MFLDLNFVRAQFPSLNKDWIFFDNAGGAQVPLPVITRITDYLNHFNVQHGASYLPSVEATNRIESAVRAFTLFINARYHSEIVFGSSTTQLLRNLSLSLGQNLKPGDEIIVSNSEHEANIGPWISLRKAGIKITFWKVNPETFLLDLNELETLLNNHPRLLAITHASNIFGHINPIREIVTLAHSKNTLVCVDGVGYAPHRKIDVQALSADFYCFSLYKTFGPHQALLYIKQEILESLPGINHFFINEKTLPYKLQPGNINYELTYGALGIIDYLEQLTIRHFAAPPATTWLEDIFSLIAAYEEILCKRLLAFLTNKPTISIIGSSGPFRTSRLPIISFIIQDKKSDEIVKQVDNQKIGIRFGDFYARRLINELNLDSTKGVVRVSLVHYNTVEEVDKLIDVLDRIC